MKVVTIRLPMPSEAHAFALQASTRAFSLTPELKRSIVVICDDFRHYQFVNRSAWRF